MSEYLVEKRTCYFCAKNIAAPKAAFIIKMYGNVKRTGTYKRYRLTWDNISVKIPRCEKCKNISTKIDNLAKKVAYPAVFLAALILVVPFLAGWKMSGLGWIGLCVGSLGIVIVSVVGALMVGMRINPDGMKTKQDAIKENQQVQDLLKDGWKIGDRPAS